MNAQPLIAVRDVEASSRWYQKFLDCQSAHGSPDERVVKAGDLLLQLHVWNDHEHPNLGDPDAAPHGYGVLLWFQTDQFDAAIERADACASSVLEGPQNRFTLAWGMLFTICRESAKFVPRKGARDGGSRGFEDRSRTC